MTHSNRRPAVAYQEVGSVPYGQPHVPGVTNRSPRGLETRTRPPSEHRFPAEGCRKQVLGVWYETSVSAGRLSLSLSLSPLPNLNGSSLLQRLSLLTPPPPAHPRPTSPRHPATHFLLCPVRFRRRQPVNKEQGRNLGCRLDPLPVALKADRHTACCTGPDQPPRFLNQLRSRRGPP